MSLDLSVTPAHLWYEFMIALFLGLLYLGAQRAYPRPIPGIPYNRAAARQFTGDVPEIQARQNAGESVRPWFLEQARRHNSAIVQIFLGPLAKPAVLISDYREVNDILSHRDADFKRGKKVDVFRGVLPYAHPSMETFDPRFKSCLDLVKDLMAPSFLYKVSFNSTLCGSTHRVANRRWQVSAPHTYAVACNLLDLWQLKTQMTHGIPIDVAEDIVEFSFDAIVSAATGLDDMGGDLHRQITYLHSLEAEFAIPKSFRKHEPAILPRPKRSTNLTALSINEESLWKGFYMPWPTLYHAINKLRPSVRNATRTLRGYINFKIEAATRSLEEGGTPQSALDRVIQREVQAAEKEGRPARLDDPRIRDQICGYLIAGHDTSTGSVVWLLRRLMAHPEEQIKIRNDLRAVYSAAWKEKRLPTSEELVAKMSPYLEGFIEEVLRYNSPVVTVMVETRRETAILGHVVPVNTPVFLNLTGPSMSMPSVPVQEKLRSPSSRAHNALKDNWDDEDPGVFRPERWLKEDGSGGFLFSASRGPSLAFSAGNRGCWGKRLGYLELKIVLTLLVWKFDFGEIPHELDTWETYDSLVTAPKHCYVKLSELTY